LESFRPETIPNPNTSKEPRSKPFRVLFDILETVILSLLLFIGIDAVTARIRVDGQSMEPTLQSGEFVIVNKLAYKLSAPELSDVIVFHYPRDPKIEYIKRVIGLPGDVVKITNGSVLVNEQQLDEPYIKAPPNYQAEWTVPEDSLFVLGDNRNNSSDSRTWGMVPVENIIGRAELIYWPPDNWGVLHFSSAVAAGP